MGAAIYSIHSLYGGMCHMNSYKHMHYIIENRRGVQEKARITHFMEYKGQCHEKDISFLFFEDWK